MSLTFALCCATMRAKSDTSYPGDLTSWLAKASSCHNATDVRYNTPEDNLGVVGSYQWLYERRTEDVLIYTHDDVIMREQNWDRRLLDEFEDPEVGIVGLGGAKWHGVEELYKVPYVLQQLRRGDYVSNVDDAEVHGERFNGATDCAVLDGFTLCVRRSFLDRINGWNQLLIAGIDFIAYDYVICALARRYGYKIRVVGLRCHHRGGGTSVGINVDRQKEYDYAHR